MRLDHKSSEEFIKDLENNILGCDSGMTVTQRKIFDYLFDRILKLEESNEKR